MLQNGLCAWTDPHESRNPTVQYQLLYILASLEQKEQRLAYNQVKGGICMLLQMSEGPEPTLNWGEAHIKASWTLGLQSSEVWPTTRHGRTVGSNTGNWMKHTHPNAIPLILALTPTAYVFVVSPPSFSLPPLIFIFQDPFVCDLQLNDLSLRFPAS